MGRNIKILATRAYDYYKIIIDTRAGSIERA
jgi:hypothetical protein